MRSSHVMNTPPQNEHLAGAARLAFPTERNSKSAHWKKVKKPPLSQNFHRDFHSGLASRSSKISIHLSPPIWLGPELGHLKCHQSPHFVHRAIWLDRGDELETRREAEERLAGYTRAAQWVTS